MTNNRVRSAIVTGALVMALMTPAYDGGGHAVAAPWYRNTFVKLRAAGTHAVELPTPMPAKRPAAQAQPASQPAPAAVQVPGVVQNLRRADGR